MATVSIGGFENIQVSDEIAKLIEFSKQEAGHQYAMAERSGDDADVKQAWIDSAEKSIAFGIQLMQVYFAANAITA